MNTAIEAGVTIVGLVIAVAIVSVLVSKNAQTPQVIQASASGLSNLIGVAQAPVTGTAVHLSLGYPSANNLSYGFGS
jgi:hypothetical protein